MSRPRQPIAGLLLLPVLLIVGLLVVLHLVRDATAQPPAPDLVVDALPPVVGEPTRCTRQGEPDVVQELRSGHVPGGRITSALVTSCPAAYDGQEVLYAGELVGDLLHRDGGAWVMVNDDDYALEVGPLSGHDDPRGTNSGLSVWLPDDLLDDITGLGQPGQRGDVVAVHGRIVRTDPHDGGGLTLRADAMTIEAPATPVGADFDLPQALFALAAAGVGGLLWTVRRRSANRQ